MKTYTLLPFQNGPVTLHRANTRDRLIAAPWCPVRPVYLFLDTFDPRVQIGTILVGDRIQASGVGSLPGRLFALRDLASIVVTSNALNGKKPLRIEIDPDVGVWPLALDMPALLPGNCLSVEVEAGDYLAPSESIRIGGAFACEVAR